MTSLLRASDTPFAVHVEQGNGYRWCACGQSKAQPFCDGSHKAAGVFAPVKSSAEGSSTVYVCGCWTTNSVPRRQRELRASFDVPSVRGFIALLEAFRATGGTAPGEIVDRLLEERQVGNAVSLAKLVDAGQAFGFEWRDSLWIPMFQFDASDLAPNPTVQSVRAELPSLWSGWTLACWFAGPNARLDGRSPAAALDSDPDAVVRAARSLESVAEFSLPLWRWAHAVAVHV